MRFCPKRLTAIQTGNRLGQFFRTWPNSSLPAGPAPTLEPRAYYAYIYIYIYTYICAPHVTCAYPGALPKKPTGRPAARENRAAGRAWGAYPVPTLYLPCTYPAPTLEPPWVARGRRQGPWPGIYGSRGVRRHSGTGWRPGETHVHVDGWPTHRRGTGSQVGQMLRCWKRKKKRSKKRTRCQARPKGRMNKSIVGPNPSRAIHPSLVASHARPPYAYAHAPTLYLPYTYPTPHAYPVPTLHPALYLYLTVTVTVTVTLTRP